jgi:hypothetical protein
VRPRIERTPHRWLYDYDSAAVLLGYSPGYVKKLCDTGRVGYFVKTYRHGSFKRRVRFIPHAELISFIARRWTVRRARQ